MNRQFPSLFVLVAGLLLTPGCGARVALIAPPVVALGNVVQVRAFSCYAKGDRVFVKTVITNVSGQPIVIDRDGFALKLPDGQVIPRASGATTQHKPYAIGPGEGRDVYVDFHADRDVASLPGVAVVVGGVFVGADPAPHVVGEIPLVPAR